MVVRFRCPNCGQIMDDDVDLVIIDKDSVDFQERHEYLIFEDTGLEIWVWRCPYCGGISLELSTKWYDGITKVYEPYEAIKLTDRVYILKRKVGKVLHRSNLLSPSSNLSR